MRKKIKYQSFLSSRKEIDEILSKYNDKFEKLPKTSISFARLQRDREVKERLYILVQEKYQEALVNEQAVPANVLILDPARKALYPFAPNRPMIIIVGLLVGAALSIGVILARHFMSGSVITPEDIQKIGLKVVAWIPKIGFIGGKNEVKKEFVVFSNPSSNNAEAFRAPQDKSDVHEIQRGEISSDHCADFKFAPGREDTRRDKPRRIICPVW